MRASALGLTIAVSNLVAFCSDVAAKDKKGKGAFDHAQEIKDEEN